MSQVSFKFSFGGKELMPGNYENVTMDDLFKSLNVLNDDGDIIGRVVDDINKDTKEVKIKLNAKGEKLLGAVGSFSIGYKVIE